MTVEEHLNYTRLSRSYHIDHILFPKNPEVSEATKNIWRPHVRNFSVLLSIFFRMFYNNQQTITIKKRYLIKVI